MNLLYATHYTYVEVSTTPEPANPYGGQLKHRCVCVCACAQALSRMYACQRVHTLRRTFLASEKPGSPWESGSQKRRMILTLKCGQCAQEARYLPTSESFDPPRPQSFCSVQSATTRSESRARGRGSTCCDLRNASMLSAFMYGKKVHVPRVTFPREYRRTPGLYSKGPEH